MAVGDFDGDGLPDLALANYGSNTVSVLLNTGDGGTFAPQTTYAVGNVPWTVAIGDFNGDGLPDIAVVNNSSNSLGVLLNMGGGKFGPQVTYAAGGAPQFVAVGDFNGDGYDDLAVANAGNGVDAGTVSVFINLGTNTGKFAPQVTYAAGLDPRAIAVGDLNGDGPLDLVVANQVGSTVSVFINLGDGGAFAAQVTYAMPGLMAAAPESVAVGSFSGDGGPLDLAVADANNNVVDILLNDGTGAFGAPARYGMGELTRSPEPCSWSR